MKNKLIVAVVGLTLALTGCSFSSNKTSDVKTTNNTPSSQQTPNSDSRSSNTNSGSSQSSGGTGSNQNTGTSTSSSNTASNSPAPPVNNPIPSGHKLDMSMVSAVRLADFHTGWAGGNGWVAKTINGGKSWAVVYQGSGTVQQIFALNHLDVWVTLNQGGNVSKILHSVDGGQHWTLIGTTPNNAFLHFTSKTTAFSGNDLSTNGGKTWDQLPVPKTIVGDAYFHDNKNGWAVTQSNHAFYVNRTTDGGKSWETVMTKSLAEPMNGAQIRSAGTNDAWIELIGGTGMTQTSYSVFHTTDGGKSWKTVIANSTAGGGPAPGFSDYVKNAPNNKGSKPGPLYVVNSQVAFMGGSCPACDKQNSIGWTKDAGKTWVNSNVTLEGYGDAYLAFADVNYGWWITTENGKPSIMYTTSDGGIHWKEVYKFH